MSFEEMEAMVATFGDQLRWAAALDPPRLPTANHVLVAGMGGSGISGDLASVLANVPLTVHKSYGLPLWAGTVRPQIIALSYSGNTEETLSAVKEAVGAGLIPAVITGGGELAAMAEAKSWPRISVPAGMQPRAALGYMFGAVLRFLESAKSISLQLGEMSAAADQADELSGKGGKGWAVAADLADGLDGRFVGVYGSTGLTAPIAQRWKTQINENAKWPAWYAMLPELDHNEIVSWTSLADVTRRRVGIVCLRDHEEHPGTAARFNHTAALTSKDVAWVGEVWSQGTSRLERLVSLVAMGDLVSLELARRASVDPVPVDVIENLKRLLAADNQ
jgi:glucose/mannose-6-phosphate isomerase